MLNQVDWMVPLGRAVATLEQKFTIKLTLDSDVVGEVASHLNRTVSQIPMNTDPNVAKIAGHVAFWIRKLKPIGYDESQLQTNKLLNVNELAALLVGAAICRKKFKSDLRLHNRIFFDWASSLRVNSHSPSSCAIAFELLALSA